VKPVSRSNRMAALARSPVFPEAHRVGALSAQLKRPRRRPATGALRRLQSVDVGTIRQILITRQVAGGPRAGCDATDRA
jgi:hypothetical protein